MGKQIQTKKGRIEGVSCGEYTVYKGIPYAKPPIGELRWKAPQEAESWEGVYKADTFSDICIQTLPSADNPFTGRFKKEFYDDADYIPKMSEDCLYLNIWTPKDSEGKKLPVAFWIHGGGFGGGYGSEIEFDGEAFCQKDVILVTVNYRLNVFGFLAHPWLSAENEKGISGNYGILDQILALHWVYDNIEAFGGDPDNITIFGQSAGSMSTQVLISSGLTGDIPAKAIMQSGISCEEKQFYAPALKEEEELGELFVKFTGAKNARELRALAPEELMAAREKFDAETWKLGKGIVLVPNVDGYVLTDTVRDVWKQGKMKNIPYMTGCVTDDLGSLPEEVKEKRPGILLEECKRWSLKQEECGNPAYVYHFSHELPGDDWGSFHTAEVWYMMGTLGRCWRPMEEYDFRLSEKMVSYWTNFMKTGNPTSEDTEGWDTYTEQNPFVKIF